LNDIKKVRGDLMEDDVIAQALRDAGQTAPEVKEDSLSTVSRLATRQLELTRQVQEATEKLERLQSELKMVSERDLPIAMLEAGFKKFVMDNGASISIEKYYGASISVDNRPRAFQWLIDNGHAGILKTEVTVPFGKGQDARDEAKDLADKLKVEGYDASHEESVHPQTLKAWVREQLENGARPEALGPVSEGSNSQIIPAFINIFEGDRAKIKLPKDKS
jgi:hypothetical protein